MSCNTFNHATPVKLPELQTVTDIGRVLLLWSTYSLNQVFIVGIYDLLPFVHLKGECEARLGHGIVGTQVLHKVCV